MKISIYLLILSSFILTSCFDQNKSSSNSSTEKSETSLINETNWKGAKTALNKISGIHIQWDTPSIPVKSFKIYRLQGRKLDLLATLAANTNGYIDGTVTWGVIYNYVVRAIDTNDVEDQNLSKVTALAWGGISSATGVGRNSIRVEFSNPSSVVDEIRIYLKPKVGGEKELVHTADGSETTIDLIDNIRPGFEYVVSAQAYVSSLQKEDGNEAEFEVTTLTLGYHDDVSSNAKWMNLNNVRAFGASPTSPVHPNFPDKSPRDRLVELVFNSFNGLGPTSRYVVTRAIEGQPLVTNVDAPCEVGVKSSCRVKCTDSSFEISGVGGIVCRDRKVDQSPARYRYTISLVHSDNSFEWVEPVPQNQLQQFSVLVPIPPNNMILVQRDAANYEMCAQMNLPPDPKKNNRCPYTGIGATPYNAGPFRPPLNLESGFYDFGYNLFQDRYTMSCNWTSQSEGGMCGVGPTAGDCIEINTAAVTPANNRGKDGDVMLSLASNDNRCYFKMDGVWRLSRQVPEFVADARVHFRTMYTSIPKLAGKKLSTMNDYINHHTADVMCRAHVDPNYGEKRMPRLREVKAYNAYATLSGDLYGMTYNQALTIRAGGNFDSTNGFRCSTNLNGVNYPYPTDMNQMLSPSNELMVVFTGGIRYGADFVIGAEANQDCITRYGAHEVFSNRWSWTSDTWSWNKPSLTLKGMNSRFDNGNFDLMRDINGGQSGFVMNHSNASTTGTSSNSWYTLNWHTDVKFIAIPLGLPILNSGVSSYLPRALFAEHYDEQMLYPKNASEANMGVQTRGRWFVRADVPTIGTSGNNIAQRCVLTAD